VSTRAASGKALTLKATVLVEDYAGYDARGLLGQHGLSVLLEVAGDDGVTRRVLLDVGQSFSVIARNASILKVKELLRRVDSVVLSHNHYDHSGGLPGFLKWLRLPPNTLPLYAHPDAFLPSIVVRKGRRVNVGVPATLRELEAFGANPVLSEDPAPVEDVPGTYFLGEVPRVRGPEPRVRDNYVVLEGGAVRPHPLRDDTALAVVVEGYGAVVITGCSHSGILNVVEHAAKVTGETVRAVLGGLHLISSKEAEIEEVKRGLRDAGVEELHVGHCTGLRAECELMRELGKGFRRIKSGYIAEWGSRTT